MSTDHKKPTTPGNLLGHRLWQLRLLIVVVISIAVTGGRMPESGAAGSASASISGTEERDMRHVASIPPALSVYLDDLRQLLPPTVSLDEEWVEGSIPHLILIAHGEQVKDLLRAALDLAGNHQLYLEYQRDTADPSRIGLVLSPSFPRLDFSWESHPGEDVPTVGKLWRTPFADLSDVAEVHSEGEGQSLLFAPTAASRIDSHADLHGHRRFQIRPVAMGDLPTYGPYIWMPGLQRIAGLPMTISPTPASGIGGPLGFEMLQDYFSNRVRARHRLESQLGLGPETLWTAAPMRPAYREPFLLWLTQGEAWDSETPFYAPWLDAPQQSRRWVALRGGAWEHLSRPIPNSWHLETGTVAGGPSLILTGDAIASDGEGFRAYLNKNAGREMAVLLYGEVVGVFTIGPGAAHVLTLASPTPECHATVLAWANGSETETLAALPDAPVSNSSESLSDGGYVDAEDYFQVRLMAEPQEREVVPVTHFAAPGAARGVVVAVLNDIILDSRSISGAWLETRTDHIFIHLRLTDDGREALSDACFTHLGKQLAIVYQDQLLSAPTIVDWDLEELTFKGSGSDWPDIANGLVARFGSS